MAASDGPDALVREALLADLVDRIQHVSRKVAARPYDDPRIVPLSPLESLVLQHLERRPGLRSAALARELSLRGSNASAILGALVEKGMLRREADPADGRAASFHPTDAAHESIARVKAQWTRLLGPTVPEGIDLSAAIEALDALETALDAE